MVLWQRNGIWHYRVKWRIKNQYKIEKPQQRILFVAFLYELEIYLSIMFNLLICVKMNKVK